jgi:hypothetical protein
MSTVKHETKVTCNMDNSTVLLQGINCDGLSADEQKNLASGIDVKFRFTASEGSYSPQSITINSGNITNFYSSGRKIPEEGRRNENGALYYEPPVSTS